MNQNKGRCEHPKLLSLHELHMIVTTRRPPPQQYRRITGRKVEHFVGFPIEHALPSLISSNTANASHSMPIQTKIFPNSRQNYGKAHKKKNHKREQSPGESAHQRCKRWEDPSADPWAPSRSSSMPSGTPNLPLREQNSVRINWEEHKSVQKQRCGSTCRGSTCSWRRRGGGRRR